MGSRQKGAAPEESARECCDEAVPPCRRERSVGTIWQCVGRVANEAARGSQNGGQVVEKLGNFELKRVIFDSFFIS